MLNSIICNFCDVGPAWQVLDQQPRWKYNMFAGSQWFWRYDVVKNIGSEIRSYQVVWDPDAPKQLLDLYQGILAHAGIKFIPHRCIINGQTQGQDGAVHSDFSHLLPNTETFLLYLNPQWQQEWGGATVFFDQEKNKISEVLPEPGKLISYPGGIKHQGCAPVVPNVLRVTMTVQGRYA